MSNSWTNHQPLTTLPPFPCAISKNRRVSATRRPHYHCFVGMQKKSFTADHADDADPETGAAEEDEALECQTGISKDWGGRRRSLPYASTEQEYFQFLDLPSASQVNIVSIRFRRVSSRLASVIHSTYSFLRL